MLQGVPKTVFRQLVSVLGSQYRYPSSNGGLGYRYPSPSIDTRCINKGVSIPSLRYRYLGAFQGVPIPSLAGTDTQIPVLELGTDTTDRPTPQNQGQFRDSLNIPLRSNPRLTRGLRGRVTTLSVACQGRTYDSLDIAKYHLNNIFFMLRSHSIISHTCQDPMTSFLIHAKIPWHHFSYMLRSHSIISHSCQDPMASFLIPSSYHATMHHLHAFMSIQQHS
ncbi:hypothetical protein V6N12_038391 [Hibiscus sabdariffa]|uniref:Uncharacterized protein n=1 Tax=Hibiscus sabdariffa TaxID=183260 RepID=A0ABR2BF36_9ROSI